MTKIKVSILGSGSKGNCTLIETDNTKLMIDCGFSARETTRRLQLLGVNPEEINGILLTHEHSDHTMGLENFASKFNVPIFANALTLLEYERSGLTKTLKLNDIMTQDFYFRELTISPFDVSHDSKHCLGFSVYCEGEKFSLATDLGYVDDKILNNLQGSNTIVLESNHDPQMLKNNVRYPQLLKERILSKRGHLSNVECANAILNLAKSGTKNFILAHLSKENNIPALAKSITENKLIDNGADTVREISINVASQDFVYKG